MLRVALAESEIRRLIGLPEGGNRVVDGLAQLDVPADRCLYFVSGDVTPQIQDALAPRRGGIIIAPPGSACTEWDDWVVLECAEPRAAMANVLAFLRAERRVAPLVSAREISPAATISPQAVIDGAVEIGSGAVIEPFCVIGPDVKIGSDTIICSGVRVFPGVEIGASCWIGPNAVIGHDGYGFVRDQAGHKVRMTHLGGVRIGSYVHIGALTTVPAGTIVPTRVADRAKVDDHVHVGHNVQVGESASVTAGVILGGHCSVAREAWIGMNASIRDGRRVGEEALVGMDASVQQDVQDGAVARAPRPDVRERDDDQRNARTIGFRRK